MRIAAAFLILWLAAPAPARANDDRNFYYIGRGLYRILTAAFEIPKYMIQKTVSEPLGIGTVDGVLTGAFYSVGAVLEGTLDIARGAVPYGKYLLFFA